MRSIVLAISCGLVWSGQLCAQSHEHHHGDEKPVSRPRIFLDKSLRVVQYQLRRLDNERLLMVERKTSDKKYVPVYAAILTRDGMSPQYREEALVALVKLNKSTAPEELLGVLSGIDADDRQQRRTARQIALMLVQQPAEELKKGARLLREAISSENAFLSSVGHAGLVAAGELEASWMLARKSPDSTLSWLAAVSLVPTSQRAALRERVTGILRDADAIQLKRAAIQSLAAIAPDSTDSFVLVSSFVANPELRGAAVKTLLTVPEKQRDNETSRTIVDQLVVQAEATPAAERTTDSFIDAMQLVDQLLWRVPVDEARSYRERLRAITVRVVRIHTVEEEMRYDIPFFAVEAGRPVQVILENEDLMPHNLVLTVPGSLQKVAELGLQIGPQGQSGKPYVPNIPDVLHATGMVQPGRQERLTFTAPTEPGEYPYVCTFPRHWMRMYGVMVVVPDLDAWLQDPVEPQDPIGSNRSFVQAWKIDDFEDLEAGMRGRSAVIGAKLFTEATCAQCHKAQGKGGAVGPDLTEVFARWKGDRRAVLREMLEPSHRIDSKYAVHVVYTDDGRVVTGIVTSEDKQSVSILDNPETPKPTVIPKSEIDEMLKTSKSMMPKALLDRFTKDEVFELLAYLESLKKP